MPTNAGAGKDGDAAHGNDEDAQNGGGTESERARRLAALLPLWAEILIGVYLVLVAVFVLDTMIVNWRAASADAITLCDQAAKAQDSDSATGVLAKTLGINCQVKEVPLMTVRLLFWHVELSREEILLLLVSLAGVVGAQVHALRSYMWYLGNRLFVRSWVAWYLVRPFVGALLGLLVYVVFRAGFLATSPAESLNPYGFVAIAGLVGLFAEQALGKLKDTAETLLSKPPKGKNHAPADENGGDEDGEEQEDRQGRR